MFKIVNTCNFDSDYPNERFLADVSSKGISEPLVYAREGRAQSIANILNGPNAEHNNRWWKVVPKDYQLKPGFEP